MIRGERRTIETQAELVPKNYESGGQEFESLRARQLNQKLMVVFTL